MTGEARQLPLPFPIRAEYAAADFIAAPSNREALAWLARAADWPFGRLVLYGPPGSGKTHLLHLWAAQAGARLFAGQALGLPPPSGSVGVDDADLAEEVALFHLINAAWEAGQPLLMTARAAPARWATRLPDLASRLRATTAAEIGPAEDALLRPLLARLLAARQLDVPMAMQAWLLDRLPREPAALMEAVARLDRAALAQGRGVSRALVAAVLAEMAPDRRAETAPDDEIYAPTSPQVPALL